MNGDKDYHLRWQYRSLYVSAEKLASQKPIDIPVGWELFGATDGNSYGRVLHLRRLVPIES